MQRFQFILLLVDIPKVYHSSNSKRHTVLYPPNRRQFQPFFNILPNACPLSSHQSSSSFPYALPFLLIRIGPTSIQLTLCGTIVPLG